MSATKLCGSLSSKQTSRYGSRPFQCVGQTACFRRKIHGSKCFAEEVKPFRAQLYESTHQRLQREREEQERFAELSFRGDTRLGRTFAITFGWSLISLESSSTDLDSDRLHVFFRLLLRNPEACTSGASIYSSLGLCRSPHP